ncbi:MAG TPA: chorismate-binding protein, partial [Chthoniobacteraceae bacterium]|nr:chorismate-binding protein [Chthoniobacteraceae bacterium]
MTSIPLQPSLDEFRKLAVQGNLIPVHTEIIADAETPVSAFQKVDDGGYSFLLESVEKSDQAGRYSFVGSNPRVVFESQGRRISITEDGQKTEFETDTDPLAELQKLMSRYKLVTPPEADDSTRSRFTGGAVGYLSYDMVRFFEPSIGPAPKDELQLPESFFLIAETILIFDHRTRRLRILANAFVRDGQVDEAYAAAARQIEGIAKRLSQPTSLPAVFTHSTADSITPRSNTTPDEYKQMVRDAHEYIHAGDIFQIVPSQRFETEYAGDPLELYRSLRFVNPSPYMFCLKFAGRFALVGSSPEVHVRAMDGNVEIRPIAGTKRRGATDDEDDSNAQALLADPKERAEHLML